MSTIALLRLAPGIGGYPFDAIEAFSGWALGPAWLALGLGVARRAWALVALAAPAALVHAGLVGMLVAPSAGTARADAERARLRVATANLYAYNERARALAEELAAIDADVIALEELTPRWVDVLESRGVLARYPHRILEPRDDCFGVALLSTRPLDGSVEDLGGVPMIDARVAHGARSVRVIVAHTMPPVHVEEAALWNAQLRVLARLVEDEPGPLVLTGDLNASPFGRGYRALLDAGLRGAHESVGRGLATTWPNGTRALPPMRLDHVLVSRDVAVRSVREGIGEGSDHRPVIAELAL